jgi:hypothetical protein
MTRVKICLKNAHQKRRKNAGGDVTNYHMILKNAFMIYSFCMHFYYSKLTFFHTTRIFVKCKTKDFDLAIVSYHFCFRLVKLLLRKKILHYLSAVTKFLLYTYRYTGPV